MRRSKAPSKILQNNENCDINVVNHLSPQFNKSCQIIDDDSLDAPTKMKKLYINTPYTMPLSNYQNVTRYKTLGVRKGISKVCVHDPNVENALVLYTPPVLTEHEKLLPATQKLVHVVVDPVLCKFLRPHQREGVKFMYDCLTGINVPGCYGCIMADDMGLGKTLQSITVMYTLLRQSPRGLADFTKAIIVCPASLVKNWEKEIEKWLGCMMTVVTVEGGGKEIIESRIEKYKFHPPNQPVVIIISYESFRTNVEALSDISIGLIICDEGHRLKNQDNQIYQALINLTIQRRVLISGTPIQNDLLEYFSLVHFVNQGILGTRQEFKKNYENPILKGRDSLATDNEREKGDIKLKDLLQIVNKCIIRRTAAILSNYLPIKIEHVICVKLTPLQHDIYNQLLQSKSIKSIADSEGMSSSALALITLFKKLCNHPLLICDLDKLKADGFAALIPVINKYKQNRSFQPEDSGKFKFLDYLIKTVKQAVNDKIVVVSNYTQTLDLVEQLCRMRNCPFLRLDGSISIKKRQKMVDRFNDPAAPELIFMLSSKAGGCGLNLIGANRLVMLDPDWNPANDAQAMARVWRDGQKKLVYIYRLVASGTIEEKILQRQAHKKALSSCVVDELEEVERHFSKNDLRDLFRVLQDTPSSTHDCIHCKRCLLGNQVTPPPDHATCTSDLSMWQHAWNPKTIDDHLLKTEAWNLCGFSFIFHQKSHKKQLGLF